MIKSTLQDSAMKAIRFAFITLSYFLVAKLGLQLAFVHPNASPIWPATGLAIAAVLLLGYRIAPAIFIGAFVANQLTAGSVLTSLGIALGNTQGNLAAEIWIIFTVDPFCFFFTERVRRREPQLRWRKKMLARRRKGLTLSRKKSRRRRNHRRPKSVAALNQRRIRAYVRPESDHP